MRELTIAEKKTFESEVLRETGARELPEHISLYDSINAMTIVGEGGGCRRGDWSSRPSPATCSLGTWGEA